MALDYVTTPAQYYPDFTTGRPIFNGDIYVGEPDTDPEIPSNQKQITVLQEDGTLVEVVQPMHTSSGGVPIYNGSPVQMLVDGNYSIKVLNKQLSQIYYVESSISPATSTGVTQSRARTRQVATAGQTLFTTASYVMGIGDLSVAIDGVLLGGQGDEYDELTSTTFELTTGALAGQSVDIYIGVINPITEDASGVLYTPDGGVTRTVQGRLEERLSVVDYGATGDGVTNDAPFIQAAIDFIKVLGGGSLYFPKGVYRCSVSLNFTGVAMNLYGATSATSIIRFDDGVDGLIINNSSLSEKQSFPIENVAIQTKGDGTDIAVQYSGLSGTIEPQLAMRNCEITGDVNATSWSTGVALTDSSDFSRFDNVLFRGDTSDNTKMVAGISVADSTDIKVIGCYFYWTDVGVDIGDFSEGVIVAYNHFAPCTIGVRSGGVNTGNYIVVDNNHMDAFASGVVMGASGINGSNNSHITNNLIFKNGSSTANFIGINSHASFCAISGNEIRFSGVSGTENAIVFNSGASYNSVVGNRVFTQDGVGILLLSGADNNTVVANGGNSNGTDILDQGTANAVVSNNFDTDEANGTVRKELYGAVTYDPPSIGGSGVDSTTLSVTGAAFGDMVSVAAPYDLQGITATASVQSSGTVVINLVNPTGGAIDLASGSWKVKVFK